MTNPSAMMIGIDENGLGSMLGPMLVTSVALAVDPSLIADPKRLRRATTRAGIGDSKDACAHGSMAAVEARVLAFLARHLGEAPRDLTTLTRLACVDDQNALTSLCPTGEAPRACFEEALELPAFGGKPAPADLDAIARLQDDGVSLHGVRFASICAKRLNVARAEGRSRFDVDLDAMLTLVDWHVARAQSGVAAEIYCGKVGGRKSYGSAIAGRWSLYAPLEETRVRSTYRVPRVGTIHFVMDGDATEPAIGLASLIGKYLRELWMHRINRYWVNAVPDAKPASGYHDPVTQRLVEATALTRRDRAIPDECFAR